MSSTKLNKGLAILGIFLMILGTGFFSWYEFWGGREALHYGNVVVLSEEAIEGKIINKEDLVYLSIDKQLIREDTIVNPDDVIGKSAKHYIAPYQKLHSNYFDKADLVLGKGEYIAPIPMDWILTVPDTLRRGDEIIIYSATYESELNKPQVVASSNNSSTNQDKKNSTTDTNGGPILPVGKSDEWVELFSTTVAYVKDSANQEVITTSTTDRLNGSASISKVELVATTDEIKKIEEQIKNGGKLIIMYGNKE
ncbi:hypothetical protein ACQKMI_24410 [Lysinibacillus sp. NPDC097214]|uniref:hypothetical protein n=1 Tax=Lysinibacillus sp. NPDC097214 TaxID=3390584 RepID=UPI003D013352